MHARSDFAYAGGANAVPSIIYGGAGVTIDGGRDVTITAAQIASKGHVGIHAKTGDVSILSGEDTATSYQKTKQVFAGITLKIGQNVSGAVQQLAEAPGTATSGHGGVGYVGVGVVSGVMQAADGLRQLSNPSVSLSLMVGASGSTSTSAGASTIAVGTVINAGSLSIDAGRDIRMQGVQANVKRDFAAHAGRDLVVESAPSVTTSGSSSSGWNVGAGLTASVGLDGRASGGFTIEGGASQSQNQTYAVTQLNTHLNVGGTATFEAGRDATFAGAVVRAKNLDLDVKGNLTVQSRPDTARGDATTANVGGSVTVGIIGPSSATVTAGGSLASSDSAWVVEQTGLFGTKRVDVDVKGHTQMRRGAVVASDADDLILKTKTLTVTTLKNHDTATSIGGQVGVSTPGSPGTTPGVTVQGQVETHDREQDTIGTIGKGRVVVSDKAHSTAVDTINRDTKVTQVITKDEGSGVSVYIATRALDLLSDLVSDKPVSGKAIIAALEDPKALDLGNGNEQYASDIAKQLEFFGGGSPIQNNTPKGATQFIFPNGMVVRFDLTPEQHLGEGPHINIQWPAWDINEHVPIEAITSVERENL